MPGQARPLLASTHISHRTSHPPTSPAQPAPAHGSCAHLRAGADPGLVVWPLLYRVTLTRQRRLIHHKAVHLQGGEGKGCGVRECVLCQAVFASKKQRGSLGQPPAEPILPSLQRAAAHKYTRCSTHQHQHEPPEQHPPAPAPTSTSTQQHPPAPAPAPTSSTNTGASIHQHPPAAPAPASAPAPTSVVYPSAMILSPVSSSIRSPTTTSVLVMVSCCPPRMTFTSMMSFWALSFWNCRSLFQSLKAPASSRGVGGGSE